MDDVIGRVLSEVTACVRQVPSESLARAGGLIESAPRVFVAGAGRSGLCMKAFGMRLMHIGKTVYVVGETTTPAIAAGDLLVIGSGSGRTSGLLGMANQTRGRGADILLFTTDSSSPLSDLSCHQVIIPARSYMADTGGSVSTSIQPLGTLFEQSMLILCDSLVLELMRKMGVSAGQMLDRHANLE